MIKRQANLLTRREWMSRSLSGISFLVPILSSGKVGQPILAPGPWFTDVAEKAGLTTFRDTCGGPAKDYLLETMNGGVAIFDYNNDGLMDILLVNGSTFQLLGDPKLPRTMSRLFRNNGDGTFTDVTLQSGLINTGWGQGVAAADYDNDGYVDVFITNFGSNALFHNNGDGTFTNVTHEAGVEGGNWSSGCAWGDFDGDGRLDLYVARYVDFDRAIIPPPGEAKYCLYRGVPVCCGPLGLNGLPDLYYHNEGNGKFREVSNDVGIRDSDKAFGLGVVTLDFDNDGFLDIYVANDSEPNFLWRNKGNGTFEEVAMEAGCAVTADGRPQSSMGVAVGDYNNDGWMDICTTSFSEDYNTLYRNSKGTFDDVTFEAGIGVDFSKLTLGTGFLDFDNDGWLDIFMANGHLYPQAEKAGNSYFQHNHLWHNLRNGRFELLPENQSGFTQAWSSRGAAFGDLANSGRVWVVVNNIDQVPFLYEPSGTAGNWVRIRLTGTHSNRSAIGARVRVTTGELTQTNEVRSGDSYLCTSDIRLHFGLGQAKSIDRVEIRWPDRQVEKYERLAVNREYAFREGDENAKA
ncbi:MAG: CRTAC1 family protein [Terriglobia bacterium]